VLQGQHHPLASGEPARALRLSVVPWTLDDFDLSAKPSVDKKLMTELRTLRFLEDATDVLLIGPPGVGKMMLAVSLARASANAGYRTYYTTAA
jgi:DNA replication protein DnaC